VATHRPAGGAARACFVPRSQIDQRFFDTPYYVTPNEPVAQEAFAVIRDAMRGKGMVALGRLVLSKRERVIALEAL
jgi:DNA end-binding protein Ku